MNWKKQVNKLYSRKTGRKARMFPGSVGVGYGPAYPDSGNFDMSSVPGGSAGDGGMSGGSAAIGESIESGNEDDDLLMSDDDKLLYAIRGIIENAKIAYESISGVPYEDDEQSEGK